MVVAGAGAGGTGVRGGEDRDCRDEKRSEDGCGDGCTTA